MTTPLHVAPHGGSVTLPQPTLAPTVDDRAAALDILRRGVADIVSSEGWRRALAFRQRFHNYSFFNSSLILAQLPDAHLVAGYRAWQQHGRQVRRGERGIAILAPLLRRDPNDPERHILTGFRAVKVFDISQTDGDPIPTTPTPELLTDAPQDTAKLRDLHQRLLAWCGDIGVRVTFDLDHPQALGMYRHTDPSIALRPGLSLVQTFKTFVHEVAHHLLHAPGDARHTAELEAESTAFLVCHALGIDTGNYSFTYLAHWQRDLTELLQAGDHASKAATTILTALQPTNDRNQIATRSQPIRNPE